MQALPLTRPSVALGKEFSILSSVSENKKVARESALRVEVGIEKKLRTASS